MSDKKVDRSRRERPITPTEKMNSALSDAGTMSVADLRHDRAKPALADKFHEREERWRKDQALRDRRTEGVVESSPHGAQEEGDAGESKAAAEGGGS